MDIDCKMNIVSLEMDHDAESNLSLESGITSESSRDDADSKLDECSGWTNEKHNAYLDYLENSFVKQLYSFIGGETQRLTRTRDVQSNSLKSTDQKVNFGKKQAHLENPLRSNPENPNDKCSMRSGVQGNVLCNGETKHSGDKAIISGMYLRNSVGHECLAQSTAEASGQNFREEEEEEEEKGFGSEVTRKREREASNDGSPLKNQVVLVRMVKPRM